MKFTLSWLKDHLDTDATAPEIADALTHAGLEVEGLANPAETLEPFVVANVLEARAHPNADRLRVCRVDFGGGEPVQVVCGAPNARTGMKGVFAPAGSYVPGIDLKLKKAKIRGVESNGMLCSERELEISDEHEGIIDLPADTQVGSPAAAALGLDDPVIEIEITPNRPDCLGVRGVARDLVAAGFGTLKADPVKPIEGAEANPVAIELRFADGTADACPAFSGRLVTGLSNGPSPAWLQQRLKAIGLRPINTLVDITNYITYDRGRPLHVFDADKLQGGIHARLGEKGESVPALDGNTYEVDGEMCVIADDSGVLGLGGIIGGESTGCTEATTSVFIESAYFDPIRTAKTGRRLNIISDARYRFERGVDPAYMVPGLEQATRMVLDLCGGSPSEVTVAGTVPDAERIIDFDISEVKRLTGVELAEAEIKKILTDLGFWLSGNGPVYKVAVPSWRPDAGQAADLVEEVVRIVGVDRVPLAPMTRANGVARPVLTEGQKRVRQTKRILAGRGLVEAVTWSFIPREQAELFGGGDDALELVNPMSSELSTMRPSLLASLLTAAQRNLDRGIPDGALFEVGQAYRGDRPEDQFVAASGVRLGTSHLAGAGRHWSG
ncbi:MAG: phenylalanine--tRNA ligase subunit beta, partial [Hyphomicrobiales bacterium]|nr:phenylalanine--tRNA ligase subunit beta [Hyphomicrobiales bacterium]